MLALTAVPAPPAPPVRPAFADQIVPGMQISRAGRSALGLLVPEGPRIDVVGVRRFATDGVRVLGVTDAGPVIVSLSESHGVLVYRWAEAPTSSPRSVRLAELAAEWEGIADDIPDTDDPIGHAARWRLRACALDLRDELEGTRG